MLADFLPVLGPYSVQVVFKVEYMGLLRLLLLVLLLNMLVEVVVPVAQLLIGGLRDDCVIVRKSDVVRAETHQKALASSA